MFISWNDEKYFLKEVSIPVPCKKCESQERSVIVSKKLFVVLDYLKIPLWKNIDVVCCNCNEVIDKKAFLKEQEEEGKDTRLIQEKMKELIRTSKTPLKCYYSFILCTLIFGAGISYELFEKRAEKQSIQCYRDKPKGKILLGVKVKEEHFPYFLVYVDRIEDDTFILNQWSYGYESVEGMNKGLTTAKKELKVSNMEHFGEQVSITKGDFLDLEIIQLAGI